VAIDPDHYSGFVRTALSGFDRTTTTVSDADGWRIPLTVHDDLASDDTNNQECERCKYECFYHGAI